VTDLLLEKSVEWEVQMVNCPAPILPYTHPPNPHLISSCPACQATPMLKVCFGIRATEEPTLPNPTRTPEKNMTI